MTRLLHLSNGERSALLLSGIGLAFVSVVYTIFLTAGLGESTTDKTLMGLAGTCFEVCKFIFMPLGIAYFFRGDLIKGISVFAIGLVLMGLSVSASLGFLNSRTNAAYQAARVASPEYMHYQKQIDTIDEQIALLQTAAKIDSGSQHARVRREDLQSKNIEIKNLQNQRGQLIAAQQSLDSSINTSAGALFDGLATMFGADPIKMKNHVYFIVSLLLELCGITALSLAGINSHRRRNSDEYYWDDNSDMYDALEDSRNSDTNPKRLNSDKNSDTQTRAGTDSVTKNSDTDREQKNVTEQGDTATTGKHANRYNRVKSAIENGDLKPSVRSVMREENIGSEVAKRFFDQLQKDQVLQKVNNRYQRISK
jgi:hypothetical protein